MTMKGTPHDDGSESAIRADIAGLREDLDGFHRATKSDIAGLREDLDGFRAAAKTDIADLRKDLSKQGAAIVELQTRVHHVECNMATKDDVERLYGAVMKSAEEGRRYFEKSFSHGAILQDHEQRLNTHARRLSALEDHGRGAA